LSVSTTSMISHAFFIHIISSTCRSWWAQWAPCLQPHCCKFLQEAKWWPDETQWSIFPHHPQIVAQLAGHGGRADGMSTCVHVLMSYAAVLIPSCCLVCCNCRRFYLLPMGPIILITLRHLILTIWLVWQTQHALDGMQTNLKRKSLVFLEMQVTAWNSRIVTTAQNFRQQKGMSAVKIEGCFSCFFQKSYSIFGNLKKPMPWVIIYEYIYFFFCDFVVWVCLTWRKAGLHRLASWDKYKWLVALSSSYVNRVVVVLI